MRNNRLEQRKLHRLQTKKTRKRHLPSTKQGRRWKRPKLTSSKGGVSLIPKKRSYYGENNSQKCKDKGQRQEPTPMLLSPPCGEHINWQLAFVLSWSSGIGETAGTNPQDAGAERSSSFHGGKFATEGPRQDGVLFPKHKRCFGQKGGRGTTCQCFTPRQRKGGTKKAVAAG